MKLELNGEVMFFKKNDYVSYVFNKSLYLGNVAFDSAHNRVPIFRHEQLCTTYGTTNEVKLFNPK